MLSPAPPRCMAQSHLRIDLHPTTVADFAGCGTRQTRLFTAGEAIPSQDWRP